MYMNMLDILSHPFNLSEPCANGSMQKKPDVPMIYTLVGKNKEHVRFFSKLYM